MIFPSWLFHSCQPALGTTWRMSLGRLRFGGVLGDLCVWVCAWRWKSYSCEYSERECRRVSGSDPSDYRLYRSPARSVSKPRKKKRQHTPAYIARRRGVMSVCGAFTPIFLGILILIFLFCLSVDCELLCHWQMSTELKNNVFIDGLQFRIRKIGATEKDRTKKRTKPMMIKMSWRSINSPTVYMYSISWSELPPPSSSLHDWLLDWRPFVLLETLKNDLKKKRKNVTGVLRYFFLSYSARFFYFFFSFPTQ